MTSNPDVPPFTGYIETTAHALRLIHASCQGVIPRVTRRLNDSERRTMIRSGAVFVFSVKESGIKRWTDGLPWSPSRIVGNFLVYREIDERSGNRSKHKKPYPQGDDLSGRCLTRRLLSHKYSTASHSRDVQGAFKLNGLIKKTITVKVEGLEFRLISYCTLEDIRSGILKHPTSRPDIMSLEVPPHIFRSTNFRVPPKVEIGPDGRPRLAREAEDSPTAPEHKVEEPMYHVPDVPGSIVRSLSFHSFPNSSIYGRLGLVGHVRPHSPSNCASNLLVRNRSPSQLQPFTLSLQDGSQNQENTESGSELQNTKLAYHQSRALALEVVTSPAQRKLVATLAGTKAQSIADFLQQASLALLLFCSGTMLTRYTQVLEDRDSALSQHERKLTMHLLSKLVKFAHAFPKSLELRDVHCNFAQVAARGGFSNIYGGEYQGRTICVKALRTYEPGDNFERQLRAQAGEFILWAHLSHRNILPFYGIYLLEEKMQRICIVSPWMENGDLLKYMKNFPDASRAPLLHDTISGLQYLHDHDIVHADLKAKNVLVSTTGHAMLADFGISRICMTSATTTNVGVGTTRWMAPELLRGESTTPRKESDIWAFGCICYEVLTGEMPFHQYKTDMHLIRAFVEGSPIPQRPESGLGWDEIYEGIWSVAESCWEYDPGRRPEVNMVLASIAKLNKQDERPEPHEDLGVKKANTWVDFGCVYNILYRIRHSDIEEEQESA